jgi:hypothetical protein
LLTYSVPLFLKRQCDRTLGQPRRREEVRDHRHGSGGMLTTRTACREAW